MAAPDQGDNPPDDLTYEEWVIYVFDRPVSWDYPEWYWDNEADWWYSTADPPRTLAYLTRLFEHIAEEAAPYSDDQMGQGLWYLASNACSEHMFALLDETSPWEARQRGLRAIHTVFADLFAARCAPILSHFDEPGGTKLNSVCYMWWDVVPLAYTSSLPDGLRLNETILEVMRRTLALDHDACREGALHGLGHWHYIAPAVTEAIIDQFLADNPDLRPELRNYALAARSGCIQ